MQEAKVAAIDLLLAIATCGRRFKDVLTACDGACLHVCARAPVCLMSMCTYGKKALYFLLHDMSIASGPPLTSPPGISYLLQCLQRTRTPAVHDLARDVLHELALVRPCSSMPTPLPPRLCLASPRSPFLSD